MISGVGTSGVITYNVLERGRKHLGSDRPFDTSRLARIINSPAVQERVKNGDLRGYYGHWPREKFGMEPQEGGIINGKRIDLEPAVRTIHLKAFPDGRIEHEQEFLNTNPGRLAFRLFNTKFGGWSSAISAPKRGGSYLAEDFHGFDYVGEPNYHTNRGYVLDAALSESDAAVLDEVDHYNSLLQSTNMILDRIQCDYDNLEVVSRNLELENIELRSMLARSGKKDDIVLDGVMDVVRYKKTNRFDEAEEFFNTSLASFDRIKNESDEPQKKTAADNFITKRFGG